MTHPAIISHLGTSTKEETLLIAVGKKQEEVLILCSHSGFVSQDTLVLQQIFLSSPRQPGHMALTSPHPTHRVPLLFLPCTVLQLAHTTAVVQAPGH